MNNLSIQEMHSWNNKDLKGTRRSLYLKEVERFNQQMLIIKDKTRFEQACEYTDTYPCLAFRKAIMKFRVVSSMLAYTFIKNRYFDTFIISVIVANSIALALEDPADTSPSIIFSYLEKAFLSIYTTELVLKIVSLGFVFNKGSYLRDPWNILDCTIVITAYVSLLQIGQSSSGFSLNSLRVLRVLRPLRSVTSIKGLKILVTSLINSMPLLRDALIVLLFFFSIFAIGGVQIFMGYLKRRCMNIETGEMHSDELLCGGVSTCPQGYYCGKTNENPYNNNLNFDNILYAMLVVFVCITREGWSYIMINFMQVYSIWVFFYFIPLVFIGAYFLLNLTLAVIHSKYNATYKEQLTKDRQQQLNKFNKSRLKNQDIIQEVLRELTLREFLLGKKAAVQMIKFLRDRQNQRKIELQLIDDSKSFKSSNDQSNGIGMSNIELNMVVQQIIQPEFENSNQNYLERNQYKLSSSEMISNNSSQTSILNENNNQIIEIIPKRQDEICNNTENPYLVERIQELNSFTRQQIYINEQQQKLNKALQQNNQNQMLNKLLSQSQSRNISSGQKYLKMSGNWGIKTQNSKTIDNQGSTIDLVQQEVTTNSINQEQKVTTLDLDKVLTIEEYQHLTNREIFPNTAKNNQDNNVEDYNFIYEDPSELNQVDDHNLTFAKRDDFDDNIAYSVINSESDVHKFQTKSPRDENQQNSLNIFNKESQSQQTIQYNLKNKQNQGSFRKQRTIIVQNIDEDQGILKHLEHLNIKRSETKYQDSQKQDSNEYNSNEMMQEKSEEFQSVSSLSSESKTQSVESIKSPTSPKKFTRRSTVLNLKSIHNKLSQNVNTNLSSLINDKKQKIDISKCVQYESTSTNDVFDIRLQNFGSNQFSDQSTILINQENQIPIDQEVYIDPFIRFQHQPYQQKLIYEVESDSDQEYVYQNDKMLQQPYETVSSIGFNQTLGTFSTKQMTSKSDIIVTSTLSLTFLPKSTFIKKFDIRQLNDGELEIYLDEIANARAQLIQQRVIDQPQQKQIYQRQSSMRSNQSHQFLNVNNRKHKQNVSISDNQSVASVILTQNNMKSSFGKAFQNKMLSQRQQLNSQRSTTSIQKTLKRSNTLKSNASNQQNIQRSNTLKKKKKKKKVESNFTKFSMQDARKIIDGTYYNDEDDDEDNDNQDGFIPLDHQGKNKKALTRTMFKDKTLLQTKQLNMMDEFENNLQPLINKEQNNDNNASQDIITDDREVPKYLIDEFDLPNDIKVENINYTQIRIEDSSKKKRQAKWSGQDVLQDSLDQEKSLWIIGQLNKVRIWPTGWTGIIKRFRVCIKRFTKSSWFEHFMTTCVLANTIILSIDRYGIPQQQENLLIYLNNIFTYIFVSEMGLKIISVGLKKYLSDSMNYLDGSVVILSVIDLALTQRGSKKSNLSALKSVRIFRTFRLLRVAKLLKQIHSMQIIVAAITRSATSFFYITLLLFLFIFIFALLGMQIFGGKLTFDGYTPQSNFDTFNNAFLTSFQILTMGNWNDILINSMSSSVGKFVPPIYLISWIFIGNYILLNLFLSILLDSFLEDEEESQEKEELKKLQQLNKSSKKNKEKDKKEKEQKKKQAILKQKQKEKEKKDSLNMSMFSDGQIEDDESDDLEDMNEEQLMDILREQGLTQNNTIQIDQRHLYKGVECMNSFYFLPKRNKIRMLLYALMKHQYFERIIIMIIILSSSKLAVDTYTKNLQNQKLVNQVSQYVDIFFTLSFTLECIIKTLALGFIMDSGSYIRDKWNVLDFFIVIVSLIDLMVAQLPVFELLRLLRTLRILRFISRNIVMKMIITTLFNSLTHIFNVIIVVMIVWLMFAILGVNLFAGKFFYCSVNKYSIQTQAQCLKIGGDWLRYASNFDNVGTAMLTLLGVSTFVGWPNVMYQAIEGVAVDRGPVSNGSPTNGYFFIAFIFIGTYFFLNFFIGVLFLKYNEALKEEEKAYSSEHLIWLDMQRMIINARPDFETTNIPKNKCRRWIHKLVGSQKFDIVIVICIIVNLLQMSLYYETANAEWNNILEIINYIVSAAFTIEAILKLIAYGHTYFKTLRNRFDFIIVCSSIMEIAVGIVVIQSSGQQESSMKILHILPQLARVLRVLRVARIFRLAVKYEGIQALISTITFSLPSLFNVLFLLLLTYFMFAILGVFLFKQITTGQVINEFMNFQDFAHAMLILFRMSTADGWNLIMYDCMQTQSDGCIEGKTCGSIYAPLYFILFMVICSNILMNLFILVIIQQFDRYYLPKDNIIQKFKKNLQNFKETWQQLTQAKYNCVKIKESQLLKFFQLLKEPLGMPEIDECDMQKNMLRMGIRSDNGYIYFNELLYRCMRRTYGNLKLNKQMQVTELKTQYKIYETALSYQKQSKVIQKSDIYQNMLGKANSVNPFLTVMFLKMSFKTWLNYTTQRKRQKKRRTTKLVAPDLVELMALMNSNQEEHDVVYVYQYHDEILYITSDSEEDKNDSEYSLKLNDSLCSESIQSKSDMSSRLEDKEQSNDVQSNKRKSNSKNRRQNNLSALRKRRNQKSNNQAKTQGQTPIAPRTGHEVTDFTKTFMRVNTRNLEKAQPSIIFEEEDEPASGMKRRYSRRREQSNLQIKIEQLSNGT